MMTTGRLLLVSIFVVFVFGDGCPPPLQSCGDSCFLPALYCCVNDNLVTISLCQQTQPKPPVPPPAPTSTPVTLTPNTCTYLNQKTWTGWDFYNQFNFSTAADTSHGFVQFVDKSTATSMGLINVNSNGQIYMGVDSANVSPNGRKAVKLISTSTITTGLIVLDLAHMPGSVWKLAFFLDCRKQLSLHRYHQYYRRCEQSRHEFHDRTHFRRMCHE